MQQNFPSQMTCVLSPNKLLATHGQIIILVDEFNRLHRAMAVLLYFRVSIFTPINRHTARSNPTSSL